MTKIAVVSDIHLKLRKDEQFELGRFKQLIYHLCYTDCDVVVFNGDLLHYAEPTLKEIFQIDQAMYALTDNTLRPNTKPKKVWLLSGNHEAPTYAFDTYWYLTTPCIENPKSHSPRVTYDGVTIQMCSWHVLNHLWDGQLDPADILITHYRSKMPGLYDEEIDTSLFKDRYKLMILGDIHARYSPEPHAHYTSSPYSTAFTPITGKTKYGYIELTLDNGKYDWAYIDLDLPQKYKVELTFDQLKDFKPEARHLYRVEVTGTIDQLNTLTNTKNVRYIKKLEQPNRPATAAATTTNASFIDVLSEKVETSISKRKAEVKNILVQVKGTS